MAKYINKPGVIVVKDRFYNDIEIQATDNVRSRISWFEQQKPGVYQYVILPAPNTQSAYKVKEIMDRELGFNKETA